MKIDSYEFGKICIDGRAYSSDLIVTTDKIEDSWWRKEGHRLQIPDLDSIIDAQPDFLVVGTGYYGRMVVSDGEFVGEVGSGEFLRRDRANLNPPRGNRVS